MASQGYRDWLKAGKPYSLIRPAKALQKKLRAYGLTVYDYPNDAHLTASTPEDHTPFSVTGWPGPNARWKARALDVMPRSESYAHRKENADIARQIIRDRNAGVPGVMWIKYLNWTDENGTCRQERWTPGHATRSSTDNGHIHISGRSDVDDDARADDYDPIARAAAVLAREDDDMIDPQQFDDMQWRMDALFNDQPQIRGGRYTPDKAPELSRNRLHEHLVAIDERLAALAAGGAPSQEQVTAAVREVLPELARLVAAELRELRFAAPPQS
ncbi:hypothetical protein Drose_04105 [Dactylosporangium roseum]|uniref:Uncharacterized protein n=2 Tax=Dactylosporangium roseum TaxID=47989 RepID=A0ABY5Z6J3_9ACTN|nr:hypothetical protein [Dactylosporangium roseum]UWZ37472.1 hypothetical protein Drose_04105 [Dactylosporangium roseum]